MAGDKWLVASGQLKAMLGAGSKLGPYEIVGAIGAGGMGEVYKARDTRLDRVVAIKILPPHLADTPEARQRFEREARAVSSLNHPHICTLYDVGRQNETDYLVMEYLEGETLAKRLERGALEPAELFPIAIDIADALDAAHRRGVVHRDLKPGNIMLTRAGTKLLDFGLAKAAMPGKADLSSSPTVSRPMPGGSAGASLTAAGTILGTFQYMAPEQLEGHEADARSDIFSFGALLYEMATGRKAFAAKSHASLIAAILKEEPRPITELRPMAPPALDRLVRTCLAKDPEERRQSMHDVLVDLRWIAEGEARVHASAPAAAGRGRRERLLWGAIPAVAVAAGLLGIYFFSRAPAPAPEPPVQASLLLPAGTRYGPSSGEIALSPDGTKLAFTAVDSKGVRSLWVRSLDSTVAQPLAGTDGARYPFWSPDSKAIGFFVSTKLERIDAAGGPVVALADVSLPRGGSWGPDGKIVFSTTLGMYEVSASSGLASTILDFAQGARPTFAFQPFFLPDGRHVLVHAIRPGSSPARPGITAGGGVYVLDLESRQSKFLVGADSGAKYASGYLLYVVQGNLMAQPFDLPSLELSGSPTAVAQQVGFVPLGTLGVFTASQNGLLAYGAGGASESQLTWQTRDGTVAGQVAAPGGFARVALSPDGRRAATSVSNAQGKGDIWIYDLVRGTGERFTFDASQADVPVWSPDGARVYYWDVGAQGAGIYAKASSGLGSPELVVASPGAHVAPNTISPDGKYLVYMNFTAGAPDLWIHQLAPEAKDHALFKSSFITAEAQFSPDGRWLAYTNEEGGEPRTFVASFPSLSGEWQISTGPAYQPRWRGDGKELYYMAADGRLMAASIEAAGEALRVGTPAALFETRVVGVGQTYWQYDVTGDGKKFLINSSLEERSQPVTLYANWPAALKK